MALIACPNCGKQISDRALKCPACGMELPKSTSLQCEECGAELPEGATECPACGCPVSVPQAETPQRVSVANVELKKMSAKTKRNILLGLAAVVVIVVAIMGISSATKSSSAKSYKKKLSTVVSSMYSSGLQAESACSLIHDVWYNTIYEKDDYTTNRYTKSGSTFNDDFNTSLLLLFMDSDFSSKTDRIKSSQTTIENQMKELQSPTEENKAAYTAVMSLYDSYIELSNMAINPSGNLSSFTSSFNTADAAFAKYYKAVQIYVD